MSEITVPADVYAVEMDEAEASAARRARFAMVPAFLMHFALPMEVPPEDVTSWSCTNGDTTYTVDAVTVRGPDGVDRKELPSGRYARLALIWLYSQAAMTGAFAPGGSRTVDLGASMHEYLGALGLSTSGRAYREAAKQLHLVTASVWTVTTDTAAGRSRGQREGVYSRQQRTLLSEDVTLWRSVASHEGTPSMSQLASVTFTEKAAELARHYVEVPWAAINQLLHLSPKSPFPLDIYLWLAARRINLEGVSKITWKQLYEQFGSRTNLGNFKRRFYAAVDGPVRAVWPEAVDAMRFPDIPAATDQVDAGEEPQQPAWKGHRGVVLIGGRKTAEGQWPHGPAPARRAMDTHVLDDLTHEVEDRREGRRQARREAYRMKAARTVDTPAPAPIGAEADTPAEAPHPPASNRSACPGDDAATRGAGGACPEQAGAAAQSGTGRHHHERARREVLRL